MMRFPCWKWCGVKGKYSSSPCLTGARSLCKGIFSKKALGSLFRLVMSILAPACVCLAFFLFSGIYLLYVVFVMPLIFPETNMLYILNLVWITSQTFLTLFNYLSCVFTPAGGPQPLPPSVTCGDIFGQKYEVHENVKLVYVRQWMTVQPGVTYKYCKYCNCVKPPRTHHCSITGKCVYDFDHFCPWVGQTVGYGNYRYFFLFVMHVFLCNIYGLLMSSLPFLEMKSFYGGQPRMDLLPDMPESFAVAAVFTICLAGGLATFVLLSWHIYLIATNQTTVEFYINLADARDARDLGISYKNPFDHGWYRNLGRVFHLSTEKKSSLTTVICSIWSSLFVPNWSLPPEPEFSNMPPSLSDETGRWPGDSSSDEDILGEEVDEEMGLHARRPVVASAPASRFQR